MHGQRPMIRLDPKNKRLVLKIVPYPVIFMIGGLMYFFIEIGLLGTTEVYPTTGAIHDPLSSLLSVTVMTGLLGLALGLLEELVFKNRFRSLPFGFKTLLKTILYLFIFTSTQFLFGIVSTIVNLGSSSIDAEVIQIVVTFFTSISFVSAVVFMGFIISISLFFSEIVDYLGMDVVGNFFSGKYTKPVYESRIFMFLDMRDSTTIAERIGHKKHYELINDYFGEMSNAIVQTRGSIYQYVGDEIVVSWKLQDGLENSNCLQCFFMIEKDIQNKSDYYRSAYGVVPSFKAGFHWGEVTRGQVGEIKRDLLYTGDVLNSAARIQGLCNQLGVSLLISSGLKELLPMSNYELQAMGELELKGRQKKEQLYAVKINETKTE